MIIISLEVELSFSPSKHYLEETTERSFDISMCILNHFYRLELFREKKNMKEAVFKFK